MRLDEASKSQFSDSSFHALHVADRRRGHTIFLGERRSGDAAGELGANFLTLLAVEFRLVSGSDRGSLGRDAFKQDEGVPNASGFCLVIFSGGTNGGDVDIHSRVLFWARGARQFAFQLFDFVAKPIDLAGLAEWRGGDRHGGDHDRRDEQRLVQIDTRSLELRRRTREGIRGFG